MAETVAAFAATVVALYLGAGVLFAVPFALRGVGRIDRSAEHGTWGFRLLILPGAVALWPLLARRWRSGRGDPREERNPHREAAARAAGRERGR